MADPTPESGWIRHTRPDGHRSLWFHTDEVWQSIEDFSMITGYPSVLWGDDRESSDSVLAADADAVFCPVPTTADLAWLRKE